jgi:glycosyltransferase involved in cell wall biosynthesis
VLPPLMSLLKRSFRKNECVLIDDASTDTSNKLVRFFTKKQPRLRLITHTKNLGIAHTYRELYKRAKGDIVVLFSLDGGWDPRDAIRLAVALEDGKYDMMIGVRSHKQYTLWRKIISRIYNDVTLFCFGVKTSDAGSIKAIRKQVLENIPIISKGVFDEAERIIKAKKRGYRIGYLPVSHLRGSTKQHGIRMSHVVVAALDVFRVFLREFHTT